MTHLAAQIATGYPGRAGGKVIGSGTILDTARLRSLLATHLGISSHAIHVYVLGEHGDSEVLHWSGATVATLPLNAFAAQVNAPITEDVRTHIDTQVRHAAARIIKGKGATWYGVGAGIARLVQAILDDEQTILTCCCPLPDVEGIKNVTLSLPHVIGAQGIIRTLYPILDDSERQALQSSAQILQNAIKQLQ
jgi:L-lactate dehydrogenase